MQAAFLDELARAIAPDSLLTDPADLLTYESDALAHLRATPGAVVLPATTSEVQAVVRLCHREGVPFVARGHGTGLSGGALPSPDGVLIVLSRPNRVLDIDIPNCASRSSPASPIWRSRGAWRRSVVTTPPTRPGRSCARLAAHCRKLGGAHCPSHGFTVHHVLGVKPIPNGDLVQLGAAC
jgi:glycolate oxidase